MARKSPFNYGTRKRPQLNIFFKINNKLFFLLINKKKYSIYIYFESQSFKKIYFYLFFFSQVVVKKDFDL